MDGFFLRKSVKTMVIKLLSPSIVIGIILCGCGTSGKREKISDPVAIAEKTKAERAVSEKEATKLLDSDQPEGKHISPGTEMLDYVVATVDGDPITYGEVRLTVDKIITEQKMKHLSPEDKRILFNSALQSMVTRKIVLAESKEQGYNITDTRVQSYIRSEIPEINEKFGGDIEKYADSNNIDYQQLLKDNEDDLIYNTYLQLNIFSKVNVAPREIREHYNNNTAGFFEEAAVHLYAITLYKKGNPEDDAGVFEKANEIKTKLDNGEDFEKLAKEHTEDSEKRDKGGDWGWVTKDYFASKEINQAAFELKVGEHSGVIETKVAYWIIKSAGKKAEKTKELAEVWNEIEWTIRKDKINNEMADSINKLQKKHRVILHNITSVPGIN